MTSESPRISIGLPVRNGDRFLQQTLDSLLVQTYRNYELIISDNASTDCTEAICRGYAAKDTRIRYYRNDSNIGIHGNINRLFVLSKGEYFKLASADDLCEPECLARCLDVLQNEPSAVLAYPRARFIDESGNPLPTHDPGWDIQSEVASERLRYVITNRHWVNAFYGLVRCAALSETHLLANYPGGDYRLLAELSLLGTFIEIPDCLISRRLHSGAYSQNTSTPSRMQEFHGGARKRICLPFYNIIIDHFKIIVCSSLSIGEKVSLLFWLVRMVNWERYRLLEDLKVASRAYWSNHR